VTRRDPLRVNFVATQHRILPAFPYKFIPDCVVHDADAKQQQSLQSPQIPLKRAFSFASRCGVSKSTKSAATHHFHHSSRGKVHKVHSKRHFSHCCARQSPQIPLKTALVIDITTKSTKPTGAGDFRHGGGAGGKVHRLSAQWTLRPITAPATAGR
jgi:hypothetical protein